MCVSVESGLVVTVGAGREVERSVSSSSSAQSVRALIVGRCGQWSVWGVGCEMWDLVNETWDV